MQQKHKYRYGYLSIFILFHLSLLGIIFTGISAWSLALCFALYVIRMWAITAGYHRYFSHKSFKTGRVFQFILAFLAQTSAQQGILWWANHHRHHHLYSDAPEDFHSPRHQGFWHAHIGWFFTDELSKHEYTRVADFQRYPELVWLDKHRYLPAILLAIGVFALTGLQGLVVGFCLSTILLYHATFGINSITHVYGRQSYHTGDDSRNSFLFSLLTLGEGWHNNHHYFPVSARQGFRWWQVDITYYGLKLLAWCRIISDLKVPDEKIIHQGEVLSPRIAKRVNLLIDQAGFRFKTIRVKFEKIKQQVKVAPANYLTACQGSMKKDLKRMDLMLRYQKRYVKRLPPKLSKHMKRRIKALRVELKALYKKGEVSKQAYLNRVERIQILLNSMNFSAARV